MEKHYFLNIIDKDMYKMMRFCEEVEGRCDTSILTGINFAHTLDEKFILGFVFVDKQVKKEVYDRAKKLLFERLHSNEEDWTSIIKISKSAILGNFSYRMVKR